MANKLKYIRFFLWWCVAVLSLSILIGSAKAENKTICFNHAANVKICFTRIDKTHCKMVATRRIYNLFGEYIYTDIFGGKIRCKPVSEGGIK